MDQERKKLYDIALGKINPCETSENISVGGVAVVLTKNGNAYTGVYIDASSSFSMCAERNALSTMLASGENEVDRVLSVYKDGQTIGLDARVSLLRMSPVNEHTQLPF